MDHLLLNDNSNNLTINSYDRVVVRDKVDSSLTDLSIMTRDEYDRIDNIYALTLIDNLFIN
jgi:hypothetical protein